MLRNYRTIVGVSALLLMVSGCSEGESSGEPAPDANCDDVGLCLSEPANGFQVRSEGIEIQAGEDIEYCEVVQMPGDPTDTIYVDRFEFAMTGSSHHLIVMAVEPGSEDSVLVGPGEQVLCTGPDDIADDLIPVGGSQHPYHEITYPDGVGRAYKGGSLMIFDYHYLNTTSEVVDARAAANFHTTTADKVERIVQSFGAVNVGISIEPGQEADFTETCTFDEDIEVLRLTRHTHKWGDDFNVWFEGGSKDGELVFTSANYEATDYPFDSPLIVRAGEGFKYNCAYTNTENYTLKFGLKASDEMCILFGDWVVPNVGDVPGSHFCIAF